MITIRRRYAMPRVVKGPPPYVQIQDHYRTAILDGAIKEGERLPAIAALAEEWGVAPATAAKAVSGLQVEGYVYTSTQGTFATLGKGAQSAHDRIDAVHRGRSERPAERIEIVDAGIVDAPLYVAELLGVDPDGARVARRESVAFRGPQPQRLTVQWWSAILVPELTVAEIADPLVRIAEVAGRQPTHGRDFFEGREADVREARALGVKAGDAVLASTYVWQDDEGVIEYGEVVLPRKRVVSTSYTIG
jgi:GntR family transcriptional regulator